MKLIDPAMRVLSRVERDAQMVVPLAGAVSLLLRLGALVPIRPLNQLIIQDLRRSALS